MFWTGDGGGAGGSAGDRDSGGVDALDVVMGLSMGIELSVVMELSVWRLEGKESSDCVVGIIVFVLFCEKRPLPSRFIYE